jgi:cytochrome b6-f complex iron-sulfur subunit
MRNTSAIDRRRFIAACASGACALAASSTACASLATRPVTAVNGVIALQFSEYPELTRPHGAARILPDGARDPLLVLARPDGQHTVLSTVCTHRGCAVEARGEQLVCPCHGSTYDRNGAVLRGPAEQPLRKYRTRPVPGGVEIVVRDGQ